MTIRETFGFLTYPQALSFDGGSIEPKETYEEGLRYIEEHGKNDGYIYPPQVQSATFDLETEQPVDVIPNSIKPASVFLLPASHDLIIKNPISENNVRLEDAGFLIHLMAFFFGTRLQFSDWKFDGKVPIKPSNSLSYGAGVPADFLSRVYKTWKTWNPELRKRYVNILYMHGKAKSCEWEWDSFIYQYMVFDAIYRLYVMLGAAEIVGHRNRLIGLCEKFGIPCSIKHVHDIYALRNGLFHEALWNGNTPGFGLSEAYLSVRWLERLNARLIVAIAGYDNNFVKSGWWFFGWQSFGCHQPT